MDQARLTDVGGTRPLRAVGVCLIGAVLTMIIPMVENAWLYTLVALLAACFIFPVWYGWSRGQLDYFEPIHIFGLVYFIYFGLGAIWTVQDPSNVAYDLYIVPYIPRAVLYCLMGYLALLAGYYLPWGEHRRRQVTERPVGTLFLLGVGGLGIAGFLAVRVAERAAALGFSITAIVGSLSQLSPLFLYAWALGWLLYFSKTATRPQLIALFGVLVPGAFIAAYSTFSDKSLIMTFIGVPIISRWYARRKIPWTFLIILLLLLMFVIFPFYNTYRWSDPHMGQVKRLETTYETVQKWDSDTYMRFSVGNFKSRLAMINSVAIVARDVGRWEPYAKGETILMPLVVFFIPRVLWPDKPTTTLGREFGRKFRVTNSRTANVFIGVTVPGELYWNFGLPGVLIGMAILGFGMRFLYRRYGESLRLDPVMRAIHILLLVQLAHLAGAAIAPSVVSLVRTLIVIEALRWVSRHFRLIEVLSDPESEPTAPALPATSAAR